MGSQLNWTRIIISPLLDSELYLPFPRGAIISHCTYHLIDETKIKDGDERKRLCNDVWNIFCFVSCDWASLVCFSLWNEPLSALKLHRNVGPVYTGISLDASDRFFTTTCWKRPFTFRKNYHNISQNYSVQWTGPRSLASRELTFVYSKKNGELVSFRRIFFPPRNQSQIISRNTGHVQQRWRSNTVGFNIVWM